MSMRRLEPLHREILKRGFAFSLVELMISLITISCIAAAFTPVITKKLKKQDVALSIAQTSEITNQCSGYEPKFTDKCKLCTKTYCIQCGIENCEEGQYVDTSYCGCKSCSDKFGTNCVECNNNQCTKCTSGKNKYILSNDKLSCVQCPSATPWSDGVSSCTAACTAPSGYYCDGDKMGICAEKWGVTCTECTKDNCTYCQTSYRVKPGGKGCMACDISGCGWCQICNNKPIPCKQCNSCGSGAYWYNEQCIGCKTGPLAMANCLYCSQGWTSTPGKCGQCDVGYFKNTNGQCLACSVPNCTYCANDKNTQTCQKCKPKYYLKNGTCISCSKFGSNCLDCNENKCLSCVNGYKLASPTSSNACASSDGAFQCSDSNFMRIGNLCFTRKNMGDSGALPIPSSVIVVNADETCYTMQANCCWKGNTTGSCTNNYGSYSGCNRTICTPKAGNEICSKLNFAGLKWRLPTYEETKLYDRNTSGLGTNGLQWCGFVPDADGCGSKSGCKDTYYGCMAGLPATDCGNGNYCSSYEMWNVASGNGYGGSVAVSVRCVADLTGTELE